MARMSAFIPPDQYRTKAFWIRSYVPGDGPRLAEATNASYVHLRTFMEWAKPHLSDVEAELLCRRFRGRYLLREDFTLGIFSPDDGRLLGGTGFHLQGRSLATKYAEIGMWIRADCAGRGLGTEVLRAMLDWGFDAWEWERLEWRCDTENVASRRVAEKVGMRLEGLLRNDASPSGKRRDTYIFGILRNEWLRKRSK